MRYKIKNIPKYLNHNSLKATLITNLEIEKKDLKLIHKPGQDFAIIIVKNPLSIDNIKLNNNLCKISLCNVQIKNDLDQEEKEIDIRDLVTPLWKLTYEEQLRYKKNNLEKFYKKEIEYHHTNNLYRNNCQFGVGLNELNEPTVGFRAKYNKSCPDKVYEIDKCINVSPKMKQIINELNDKFRKQPELIYLKSKNQGYIRNIMIRESKDDIIVLIQIFDDEQIQNSFEANKFAETYSILNAFLQNQNILNIYIQFQTSAFNGFIPSNIHPISGSKLLIESLLEYKFEVSFFTFFQVNVEIASKISQSISKKGFQNKTLLDLCCGSGFFGIMLNKYFEKVIGIEINQECIEQAHRNIEINNIKNYSVRMEDVDKASFDEPCTIILDPPRAGVSKKTIQNIRNNKEINEIFYVCCAYKNSYQNILDLCKEESQRYKNKPFILQSIEGFDMFPFTEDSEVLIHLKRN